MVSAIDPTVPVFGSPTTASVRNNFLIAKNEISALQASIGITFPIPVNQGGTGATAVPAAQTNLGILPISGGTMTGLLILSGDPSDPLGAVTKQYVDSSFPVAISRGGTGATTASAALANLGAVSLFSPAFTGNPTAPTLPTSDNSNSIATTAFVQSLIAIEIPSSVNSATGGTGITINGVSGSPFNGAITVALATPVSIANGGTNATTAAVALTNLGAAPINNAGLTGVPTAPTAAPGTVTTQLATTAFVSAAVGSSVLSVTGGTGITVNGATGAPETGNLTIALATPVAIANGGTGAATGNAAFDSLLGDLTGTASGFVSRQSSGAYTLTAFPITTAMGGTGRATLTANAVLVGNGTGNVTSSPITSDSGTVFGVTTSVMIGVPQTTVLNPGLMINAGATAALAANAPPANTVVWLVGDAANEALVVSDSYTTTGSPGLIGRRSRGTVAVPTAVQGNDVIVSLQAFGRGATAFSANATGRLECVALENWTDTAQGTSVRFQSTAVGAATATMRMDVRQGVIIATGSSLVNTPDPGVGNLLVNANTAGSVGQPVGITPQPVILAIGNDAGAAPIMADAYGGPAQIIGRRAGGTAAAPTAVLSGQVIFTVNAFGRGATGYSSTGRGLIQILAGENWTDTAQGTTFSLSLTTNGGTTTGTALSVDSGGNLTIAGATATKASGTTWANPSSREIKQDIKPYSQGLDAIIELKPVTYRFHDDSGFSTKDTHIGLVHDETGHMPEMHRKAKISGRDDEPNGREVDALDCSPVIFALVNAVKELAARLDKLDKRGSVPAPASVPAPTSTPAPAPTSSARTRR